MINHKSVGIAESGMLGVDVRCPRLNGVIVILLYIFVVLVLDQVRHALE